MSTNFIPFEELDRCLKEMEQRDRKSDGLVTDNRYLAKVGQERCNAGYGSPYREAYMKAHGLEP
jgi:hypothetical protein